jgi:hypothetical protein
LESGADEKEIADAIEVGRIVRKGAGAKMDKFASSLNSGIPSGAAKEGCGCS